MNQKNIDLKKVILENMYLIAVCSQLLSKFVCFDIFEKNHIHCIFKNRKDEHPYDTDVANETYNISPRTISIGL